MKITNYVYLDIVEKNNTKVRIKTYIKYIDNMERDIEYKEVNLLSDKKGKYFLYAKTGTLKLKEKIKNDRMLAVIITNRDLSQVTNPKDYKFYVVYFRYKQTGEMYNVSKIINQIIESKSFSTYMSI